MVSPSVQALQVVSELVYETPWLLNYNSYFKFSLFTINPK